MKAQQSSESVLMLTDELILGVDSAGHHGVGKDPGVLLLTEEMAPDPVIRKIDVGFRVSSLVTEELRRERIVQTQFLKRGQVEKPARRQDETVWQGRPSQDSRTFILREAGSNTQPAGQDRDGADLARILVEARALVAEYGAMRARTRKSLYEALGRTYDFTIRADERPEEFAQVIASAGLTVRDRAPYSAIVKLVFGADYDKTRVAEFAAAIAYARRRNVPMGRFAALLDRVEGGLKAVVALERFVRKGERGAGPIAHRAAARPAIARKLRAIVPTSWNDISARGDEFTLLVARRLSRGGMVVVGEVPRDIALLEKASRRLLAELDRVDLRQLLPPVQSEEA